MNARFVGRKFNWDIEAWFSPSNSNLSRDELKSHSDFENWLDGVYNNFFLSLPNKTFCSDFLPRCLVCHLWYSLKVKLETKYHMCIVKQAKHNNKIGLHFLFFSKTIKRGVFLCISWFLGPSCCGETLTAIGAAKAGSQLISKIVRSYSLKYAKSCMKATIASFHLQNN